MQWRGLGVAHIASGGGGRTPRRAGRAARGLRRVQAGDAGARGGGVEMTGSRRARRGVNW